MKDWIDAHCHLSDPRLEGRIEPLLDECARAGITRFVLGGVDPQDWGRQRELAQKHPGRFFRASGLHPWWVHDQAMAAGSGAAALARLDPALDELEEDLPGAALLGETGLDGARDRLKHSREAQLHAFEAQLELAGKLAKPVVLHVVRAHELAVETLQRHRGRLSRGGLIHSFSGNWAQAVRYLDWGLTLSVSARVTFPDATDLHETVRKAPADRLVFETDAPDQAPHGSPDKLHTPLSLLKVVQKVSEIRAQAPETLLDRSRENLKALLRI